MVDTSQELGPIRKEGENEKPLNILLVEDEKNVVLVIKRVLNGHNVISFESAEEALHELRKAKEANSPFDWVITDKGLKGKMDGFDLVAGIKTGNLGNPFVTMISGSASDMQRDNSPAQLKEKGIHQLMGKPFNIKELSDSVETARAFKKQFQSPQS